jgi:hypothetical protein
MALEEIRKVDLADTMRAWQAHEAHVHSFGIEERCGVERTFCPCLAVFIVVADDDALGLAGELEQARVARLGKASRDRTNRRNIHLQSDQTICHALCHEERAGFQAT